MPTREELVDEIQAAKTQVLESWDAYRAAQLVATRETLSEQARLTVIQQDEASARVADLKALRAEVNAAIDQIVAKVQTGLASVDEVAVLNGWNGDTGPEWNSLYHPFARLLLQNGFAPGAPLPWKSTSVNPMEWRYYEERRAAGDDEVTYIRSNTFRVPIAVRERTGYRSAVVRLSTALTALQDFDQQTRRHNIADAWDD